MILFYQSLHPTNNMLQFQHFVIHCGYEIKLNSVYERLCFQMKLVQIFLAFFFYSLPFSILINEKKANMKIQHSIIYESNDMTFWKRQIYGDKKKISGCEEQEREGEIAGAERILREMKLLCIDTIMMALCHYPFVQTPPRVTPNMNYGLWVIAVC